MPDSGRNDAIPELRVRPATGAFRIHDRYYVPLNMNLMTRLLAFVRTHWAAFTTVNLVLITTLSLWPLVTLPSVPGTDKTHHFIAYAALMFPAALRKPDKWIMIGFLFVAYSGVIELLQPYVNRYGEWLDMAANISGLVCGFVLAELLNRLFPAVSNRAR